MKQQKKRKLEEISLESIYYLNSKSKYTTNLSLSIFVGTSGYGNLLVKLKTIQFRLQFCLKSEFFQEIFSEIRSFLILLDDPSLFVLIDNLHHLMVSQDFRSLTQPYARDYLKNATQKYNPKMIFKNHLHRDSLDSVPCASEGSIATAHLDVVYRLSGSQGAGSKDWSDDVHPNLEHHSTKISSLTALMEVVTPFDRGRWPLGSWKLRGFSNWFWIPVLDWTSRLNLNLNLKIMLIFMIMQLLLLNLKFFFYILWSIIVPTSFWGEMQLDFTIINFLLLENIFDVLSFSIYLNLESFINFLLVENFFSNKIFSK